jgi:beta-phosphoglucomutase
MLRAVIFDMDGVLCDSEPFICEAAGRMFRERHGREVRPADFLPFVGAGEDRYLGGVAAVHGVTLEMPADKVRTYEIYLEIIRGRLGPLPGVGAFIAAARGRGLRLAVATSADRMKMEGNLREIGLAPASFDACVMGEMVARKKPHPDLFLRAAELIGAAPGECLVVEDAPNGLEAARAAAMRRLGLTTSFDAATLAAAGAEHTAPDLAQALPLLGEY